MAYHLPKEETLDRQSLTKLQRDKLASMLKSVLATNPFYQAKLGSISFDPAHDSLDKLPFTTRNELQNDQAAHPPYGTNLSEPIDRYTRLHQTSGSVGQPLCWLDTEESWSWWKTCWAMIYRGVGVTDADRLFFPFSFGPFIGFWAAFEASVSLGNFSLPGGGMTSTARLRHLLDHKATVLCCTPTYALRLAEVAYEENMDIASSPIRLIIVAGEPGGNIPGTRQRIESAWNARVIDHAGMTEMGAWGFECVEAPGGLHVAENEFIAEVIDPQTGQAVSEGETGELVLTNLGRWSSPLIRYRTGDQVTASHEHCACGRWFARLNGGILGRLDDMMVISGNNVFPAAVESILREIPEVVEFALETQQKGALTDLLIHLEIGDSLEGERLADAVVKSIKDRLHFTPRIRIVAAGSLPRFELKANRLIRK